MSGFPAGAAMLVVDELPATATDRNKELTILFGSQTGNGEDIATTLAREVEASGFLVQLVSLADYKPSRINRESLLLLAISTHGEGDPPDDAELFHEFLMSVKAPRLDGLQYAVLALGDSSYVNFCQTGRDLDSRLAELDASRFEPLLECDLDFEDAVHDWTARIVNTLPNLLEQDDKKIVPALRAVGNATTYGKKNPFAAKVLMNQQITGTASSKEVRHVELSLEDSGLRYEPGDSLAVIAQNPPQLIAELLQQLELDGRCEVSVRDEVVTLFDALLHTLEITALNLRFLREWATICAAMDLQALLSKGAEDALSNFVDSHQIVDVVRQFPAQVGAQQFVDTLRRLNPRSYSIASSLAANPDEVHLTVATVRYTAFGSEHWGTASTYLADRLQEGETVQVFIEKNARFRLPQADIPIIMIGPGTGVAPFRAFVEERIESGASGNNWLIFGDRNIESDFLYQLEWLRYLRQGKVQRIDVAFSRDQRHKIYVQDRIRENGAELCRWVDSGAVIYVCGDAKRMAGDVHEALIGMFEAHAGLERKAAEKKLKELRTTGRYQRDVY